MSGSRVLVYGDGGVDVGPVVEAVAGAGYTPVEVVPDTTLEDGALDGVRIVVAAPSTPAPAPLDRLMERVESRARRARLVVLACETSERCLAWMVRRPSLCHSLGARGLPLQLQELTDTLRQLQADEPYGLARLLEPGTPTEGFAVCDSRDKGEYVRAVADMARRHGCSERSLERVETVVDELCTNALFNAPADGAGVPLHAHKNRREAVTLTDDQAAELAYGFDGRLFGVRCRDPFGRLDRQTVVEHLERSLKELPERRPGAGGAGMGLFRTYQAVSRLYFNLLPGRATEVIALVDVGLSMKAFKLLPRSLHFHIEEGRA